MLHCLMTAGGSSLDFINRPLRRRVFTLLRSTIDNVVDWRWFSFAALDFSCFGHLVATDEKPLSSPAHPPKTEHSIAYRATRILGRPSSESGTADLSTGNKSN